MIPRSRSSHQNDPQPEKTAGPAGIVRRAFGQGPSPERELERVLAERRSELEEYAARFEETALELGRREERLRDERASVERLLRRSTAELEAREKELVQFERELRERDEHMSAEEAELARRRSELGAVELRRAALEQRERALEGREAALASEEARLAGFETVAENDAESMRAALLFVPGPTYRLVRAEPDVLAVGAAVQVDGEEYFVARIGRSPLPADPRRCAYLVRGAPRGAEPGGRL
jgi:DNA repair exonuclease SbcCD ATPase subunit